MKQPQKNAKKTPPLKLPKLPSLLERKIYKTGQTRGADDDVVYQNRVNRNSTVLIPWNSWVECSSPNDSVGIYENGYIVLISPTDYFDNTTDRNIKEQKLILGRNALVYYEERNDWIDNPPKKYGWKPAQNRKYPLGGQYIARIPATTAHSNGKKINEGFTGTDNKGAGIRVYEYASQQTINDTRLQLEAIFWTCRDAIEQTVFSGMTKADAILRKNAISENCERHGLFDKRKLFANRILNGDNVAICPFCLEELSASGFFSRLKQASGREVNDLTVTELNLFHIDALRVGTSNHKPYNLGWGHHHCNIVVKDEGIEQTLQWLRKVLSRNDAHKSSAG